MFSLIRECEAPVSTSSFSHLARVCRSKPHPLYQQQRRSGPHKTHHVEERVEPEEEEDVHNETEYTVVGESNKPITATVTINNMEPDLLTGMAFRSFEFAIRGLVLTSTSVTIG